MARFFLRWTQRRRWNRLVFVGAGQPRRGGGGGIGEAGEQISRGADFLGSRARHDFSGHAATFEFPDKNAPVLFHFFRIHKLAGLVKRRTYTTPG